MFYGRVFCLSNFVSVNRFSGKRAHFVDLWNVNPEFVLVYVVKMNLERDRTQGDMPDHQLLLRLRLPRRPSATKQEGRRSVFGPQPDAGVLGHVARPHMGHLHRWCHGCPGDDARGKRQTSPGELKTDCSSGDAGDGDGGGDDDGKD